MITRLILIFKFTQSLNPHISQHSISECHQIVKTWKAHPHTKYAPSFITDEFDSFIDAIQAAKISLIASMGKKKFNKIKQLETRAQAQVIYQECSKIIPLDVNISRLIFFGWYPNGLDHNKSPHCIILAFLNYDKMQMELVAAWNSPVCYNGLIGRTEARIHNAFADLAKSSSLKIEISKLKTVQHGRFWLECLWNRGKKFY